MPTWRCRGMRRCRPEKRARRSSLEAFEAGGRCRLCNWRWCGPEEDSCFRLLSAHPWWERWAPAPRNLGRGFQQRGVKRSLRSRWPAHHGVAVCKGGEAVFACGEECWPERRARGRAKFFLRHLRQGDVPAMNGIECATKETDVHETVLPVPASLPISAVCCKFLFLFHCATRERRVFLRISLYDSPLVHANLTARTGPLSGGTGAVWAFLMCTAVTRRFLFAALRFTSVCERTSPFFAAVSSTTRDPILRYGVAVLSTTLALIPALFFSRCGRKPPGACSRWPSWSAPGTADGSPGWSPLLSP